MSKRLYELALLVTTDKGADENQVKKELTKLVTKSGELLELQRWEKRPLAYPINKQNEAFYYFASLVLDTAEVRKIDAKLRLKDFFLRHMFISKGEGENLVKNLKKKKKTEQIDEKSAKKMVKKKATRDAKKIDKQEGIK